MSGTQPRRPAGLSRAAVQDLVDRFTAGDRRALARAISLIEREGTQAADVLAALRAVAGPQPRRVGLTGAPGAGKSTLLGAMIGAARRNDRTVGVLAIDPSSPFSGGALLGDRLRMHEHILDTGVFIRSMGARGQLGGLAPGTAEIAWTLGAHGFDEVMIETVGTGQSELDLSFLADTTILVLNPHAGDDIQLEKAGVLEVADIYVVNKADLPGAKSLVRELHKMLAIGTRTAWTPKVVSTVANRPDGSVDELWAAVAEHRRFLDEHPTGRAEDARRSREATAALVAARAHAWALAEYDQDPKLAGPGTERAPHVIAERLLARAGLN
ncbi:methylmalonyl Co-A mutase-associated GTPase MeaB [Actinomadura sp. LD22]|uniref:Methylmalonyl Co-A mutase-associated GTPase MeaB n=1 Tax=Actinomadura physcomitrii TaxID=2650748 RepID=A0A6I4M6E8_9ACTN|nr:methylmalonyl Co-A mutase-associated GTPase MeaB [Actinomadura physcomitrii]MVZ99853.1 methylmalonyl Co-A mutase-associated GTPase MeaB [Actinomadura physcomitrii]